MSNALRAAAMCRGLPTSMALSDSLGSPSQVCTAYLSSTQGSPVTMNHLHRVLRICTFALCALASTAGAQVTTLLDLENSPAQGYTLYTYSFQAQLAQTFLTFEFRQDPAYWRLDDVSVTSSTNTQLIANGGFENGYYGPQDTPNDWILIGQAGLSAGGRVSNTCPHSGSYCYND